MNAEKQRVAIAGACGWSRFGMYSHVASGKQLLGSGDTLHGTPPEDKAKPEDDQRYLPVPDYLNSLDACHEMEKVLTGAQMRAYAETLASGCRNNHDRETSFAIAIGADAPARCEAFLRCLNLWEPAPHA